MRRIPLVLTLAFLAAASTLLRPDTAAAQQIAGWTIGLSAEAGYLAPRRNLGKNGTELIDLPNLQVTAKLESTPMVGGGIIATSPSGSEIVKLAFTTSLDARASGGLGICGSDDQPLFQGQVCRPVEADATVRQLGATVTFLRGNRMSAIRPSFHFGAGVRSYDFAQISCEDPTDWQIICEFTREVWSEGGIAPFLQGGLGIRAQQGPLAVFVDAQGQVGRFPGTVNGTSNLLQSDLGISAGVSVSFR